MTHTEIHTEEYEMEYCNNCNHLVGMHYKKQDIFDINGNYMYTAEGCMCLTGNRKLKGKNPYTRCECMRSI